MSDDSVGSDRFDTFGALRMLSSIVLGDHSFEAVLQRATEVAKRTIPGATEVSVTVKNGHPATAASSGLLAKEADEAQYAVGGGPCLDAIRLGRTVVVDDQTTDTRWPGYGTRAVAAGVRSSCSVPLGTDGKIIGALNAYADEPGAFDEAAQRVAEDLAAYAGIVLNNASLYFTATSRADQMTEAMRSRAVIEQAKGILMAQRKCGAEEAFDVLVRLSQQSHQKLRDVARALVDHVATIDLD